MPKVKAKIAKLSRTVSVRKCPWDPWKDTETLKKYKPGEQVFVDPTEPVYDWKGREFYPMYYTTSPKAEPSGYIASMAIEPILGLQKEGAERNGSHNKFK